MVSIKTMSPITITTAAPRRNQIQQLTKPRIILLAIITLSFLSWIITQAKQVSVSSSKKCLVSHGTYEGSIYTKSPGHETLDTKCLVESPWMRLSQHTVKLPNGGGKVVDDWIWIDYHDRINVLVEAPPSNTDETLKEQKFMILEQTKYALTQMSLAVVGGIIEPKEETALVAAKREVNEELAVTCQNWIALGKFRTDVNRGMGWVHPYLARDCTYSSNNTDNPSSSNSEKNANNEEVGGQDTEKQHVQIMTLKGVKEAVMDGKFVEVQWSNTVALAVLHLS